MKKFWSVLLTLSLLTALTACGKKPEPAPEPAPEAPVVTEPEEEAPSVTFTRENLPRLDGSTSTAPLAIAVCAALLGEGPDQVTDLVHFSKTTTSYMNLLNGEADLLIVGEANGEVLEEKERLGFEWLREPFATDAFVFVVNEDNPVDSITVEQARKIYTGEITNWKELGGEDREIVALQRNQGAGSQTLMEKLVMNGQPMMEAPTSYIVTTMGDLMTAVRSYDGSPGAIGYSVYYYAQEMKMAQGLKMLKLEGVEPDPDTIRSEEYPLVNPKYVVIDAASEADSPARQLYDWLLSEEGQRMVAREGYVSVLAMDFTPKTTPLVGQRWYESYIDHLIPGGDYGTLIPYAGLRLSEDWPAGTGCLYGLMTTDGTVVTEPVYSSANYPEPGLPLLVLQKSDDTQGTGKYAVAAGDGSWCTDFLYDALTSGKNGLALLRGDCVDLMGPDGTIPYTLSRQELGLTESEWNLMSYDMMDIGVGGYWRSDLFSLGFGQNGTHYESVRVYDLTLRQITDMPMQEWERQEEPEEWPDRGEYWLLEDRVLGWQGEYLLIEENYGEDSGTVSYYRTDETLIPELTRSIYENYEQVTLAGGIVGKVDRTTAVYYRLSDMTCVFRTYLGYEAD